MDIAENIPVDLPEQTSEDAELVASLVSYKREAEQNRKGGLNPRDDKWKTNLDLYWNRYDFSNKADWQSKNVMPEVPSYVDRFAGALKDAMVSTPNGFYTVTDPYDTEDDLTDSVKKMTDVWLSSVGRNQIGQTMDFSTVFEEQVKMGALMNMSAKVTWKKDVPGGRVAIESVDPRFVWLDHTYRNLYRITRTELDGVEVARMAGARSKNGKPLYKPNEMARLVASMLADQNTKRELSGNGETVTSDRKIVTVDEYIASVMNDKGELVMDNEIALVANDQYLIRGPEKNPYWHGKDWLVYSSMMPVPLSPYGRTYMEDFGSIAKVYTDLTNLILDATYMSSMKAYVIVPAMLKDPSQLSTGMYPNKLWQLEEGYSPEEFAKALELGAIDSGSVQIWQALKSELADAGGMNEIGLGQLPDKTHISASASNGAQQASSAILRSVAQTIETRWLDPTLDLVWKTGLQKAEAGDVRMATAVGADMYAALLTNRKELIKRPYTFQARGISGLIQRSQKLQAFMSILQIVAQNEVLMQAFMQRIDVNKLVNYLFYLSNVDLSKMEPSARQALINEVTQPLGQAQEAAQQGGGGSPPALREMGNVASAMGVAQ